MHYLNNDPKSIPNKMSISCLYLSNSLNLTKKTNFFLKKLNLTKNDKKQMT